MKIQKPKKAIDLKELGDEIIKIKQEGSKIISHFNKLQEYYDDWQDRLYAVEKKIQEAESELGVGVQEIEEHSTYESVLDLIK